jgi:ABC-type phosphate transport system substrate-binding protein
MRSLITIVAVLGLALGGRRVEAQDATYKIVVNETNPVSTLTREELSRIFLKKVTTWRDKRSVQLVDLAESSPVRQSFTKQVHGREVASVKSYWQQMIFSGRAVPPPEKVSDADVLAYVAANPAAIGYVSAAAQVPAGLKVVSIQ